MSSSTSSPASAGRVGSEEEAGPLLIRAKAVVLPDVGLVEKETLIEVRNGKIIKITPSIGAIQDEEGNGVRVIDAELVTPGFVDIHTHGVGGDDELLEYWNHPDFTCSRVVKYGTTSIVASVTFPKNNTDNINEVLSCLSSRLGKRVGNAAIIDGIHAEGPIVADLGGLVESEREMPVEEFEKFVDRMGPALKVMTIAPSVDAPSGYSRMKVLRDRNVTISIGHDKSTTEEQTLGALRLGTPENPIHMTHIFNVQTFHHRDVGLANFGLLSRWPKLPGYENVLEPTIEFVGDLLHLHPLVVQLILSSKNLNKIACVTDSFLEPDSSSSITYGGRELEVTRKQHHHCPRVVIKGTTTMAGSCTTMVDMFQHLVNTFDVPLDKAVGMLATNPARICKLKGIGSIAEGNRADLLIFTRKDLELKKTIVSGQIVWEKEPRSPSN